MWQSVSLRAMCRRRRCSTLSGAVIDHSPRACSVLRLVFWVLARCDERKRRMQKIVQLNSG